VDGDDVSYLVELKLVDQEVPGEGRGGRGSSGRPRSGEGGLARSDKVQTRGGGR
jgi:hypothetical protein